MKAIKFILHDHQDLLKDILFNYHIKEQLLLRTLIYINAHILHDLSIKFFRTETNLDIDSIKYSNK